MEDTAEVSVQRVTSNIEQDAENFNNQFNISPQHQQENMNINGRSNENDMMEDNDSTDDLDDDDIDYGKNSRGISTNNLSLSTISAAAGSNLAGLANNAALFIEDDKRKRRAIANSNERRRMQSINAGFQTLKSLIPHSSGEKLSKACILQRSADFMQYLSNEKDKLNTKLQIAIKFIESNGLLNQYQLQSSNDNSSIDSNNQHTSSISVNNATNSAQFSSTKPSTSTKINKQSYYLSTINSNQSTECVSVTKTIQNMPNSITSTSTVTTVGNEVSDKLTNPVSSAVSAIVKSSSSSSSPQSPSSSTSPQSNRKSTQISSLLNSLDAQSNNLIASPPNSLVSNADSSNCKIIPGLPKNGTTTPIISSKTTMGPSTSFTASSSYSSLESNSTNNNNYKNSSNKLSNALNSCLVSKLNTTKNTISSIDEPLKSVISDESTRTISLVNSSQAIPSASAIINRQLSDTTNIKPLQPFLITNSSFSQNNIIANNLIFSSNETYSIYDSNGSQSILTLNPSCNLEESFTAKLNEHGGLMLTTNSEGALVSADIESKIGSSLVLVNGTSSNDQSKMLIPTVQAKDEYKLKKKMKSIMEGADSNSQKQENFASIEIYNLLNEYKGKNSTIDVCINNSSLDSKVSPPSHSDKQLNKIKNFKPIILNKLINSDEKTISQFLNSKKTVHCDDLIESFNDMDSIYDEENRVLSESDQPQNNQKEVKTMSVNEKVNSIELKEPSKNIKFTKTIQNIINLSNCQYRSQPTDKNLNIVLNIKADKTSDEIGNHFNNNNTTIIKSSRSNSIDQLIAAAAVTAQSSACMSPLSPSLSPPVSSNSSAVAITLPGDSNSISNSSNNLLIINPTVINEQEKQVTQSVSNIDVTNNSLSRKNLNTIVEAIFHVEGKTVLDQLDESVHSDQSANLGDDLLLQSTTKLFKSQSSQQQKPPKKRKYTTEEVSQEQTSLKDEAIQFKQPYSNQYISEYYNNNKTNQYENINKLLSNRTSNKSSSNNLTSALIVLCDKNNDKTQLETLEFSHKINLNSHNKDQETVNERSVMQNEINKNFINESSSNKPHNFENNKNNEEKNKSSSLYGVLVNI